MGDHSWNYPKSPPEDEIHCCGTYNIAIIDFALRDGESYLVRNTDKETSVAFNWPKQSLASFQLLLMQRTVSLSILCICIGLGSVQTSDMTKERQKSKERQTQNL